jgi:hypothetical protein
MDSRRRCTAVNRNLKNLLPKTMGKRHSILVKGKNALILLPASTRRFFFNEIGQDSTL